MAMNGSATDNISNLEFMQQLAGYIPGIIHRERNNRQYIYLYKMRDYWVAFDESAFLLCRLFKDTQTSILRVAEYPFPVIMVCISDDELQKYGEKHIFRRDYQDHKVIVGTKIVAEQYWTWYRMEIEDS